MNFYTYGHYTDEGRLFYIGKGQGVRATCKTSRNKHWKHTVAKHGLRVEIFARWETEAEALDHEKLLISCFRDELGVALVNCTDGGEGSSGFVMPDSTKALISESSRALWQTEAFKAKMLARPKGPFTEKKRQSSLLNAERGRAVLAADKKDASAAKNSTRSKEMWANADFRAKMKQTHLVLWDEDRRKAQGLRIGGRVRMNDGVVERNVLPAEVELLLQQGWTRGRGPNCPSKRTKSN